MYPCGIVLDMVGCGNEFSLQDQFTNMGERVVKRLIGVLALYLIIVGLSVSFAAEGGGHPLLRLPYHNELTVDLGVGLWAVPLPMDWDGDGDSDLLVSTADVPYRGLYFFENDGSDAFKPGVWLTTGKHNVTVSYLKDGPLICWPGTAFPNFSKTFYQEPKKIPYKQKFYAGRANQWKYADYDGDGTVDLLVGVSDWREYGWDDAFDSEGNWKQGPLHGYIYWIKNRGSDAKPKYGKAVQIQTDGKPLDVYGCPSPNLVDWDGDGDLDLICGEFLDRITFFENTGTRTTPVYAAGRFLQANSETIRMELEMLQVVVFDWDRDGDLDLIVGQEDGRVALIENSGPGNNEEPILKPPVFFKQQAQDVKCGALVTPCSIDWDADGDEDLICGNTAGFIEWIENLGGSPLPSWAAPKRLTADGEAIRVMAGQNGSIQGPAEAKWGYTVPYAADWDMDGLPDIVMNSITGKIEWCRNIGTKEAPQLSALKPIEVEWKGAAPKPAWNWWTPGAKELAVQWRTRPIVKDLDGDGLNDLIVIDHEGYLSFFRRERKDGSLILHPGERIFKNEKGTPLRLNEKDAGGSGRRKIDFMDWDGDSDLDLLINSPRQSRKETRNIALYENTGKQGQFVFHYNGDITLHQLEGHTTSPTTVDWDGDGIRDLLVGGEDGFFYYFHRSSSSELFGRRPR